MIEHIGGQVAQLTGRRQVLLRIIRRTTTARAGIELLAIDTFPRTVNDRCVSSPKINNLHCRTNADLCNSHTCFFHGDVPLEARSGG